MKHIMIPALCLLSGVASANECKYISDVDTSFQGIISKSQNYDRKTYPYVDNTRKCVVNMDVKIKDKWYPTTGTSVFGPDISENTACDKAEVSAKEDILRKTIPEKLNKKIEQKCKVSIGDAPKPKAAPSTPVQVVPLQTARVIPNHVIVPKGTIICKKSYMTVWIDGRKQLAYKEVCT